MMEKARKHLLLQMMDSTHEMLKKKKFSDLMVVTGSDGIVYVMSRAQNNNHNPDKLVLLNPDHPCTRLILKLFHDSTHRSVAFTVARSRIWYWIPQATKIIKVSSTDVMSAELQLLSQCSNLWLPCRLSG